MKMSRKNGPEEDCTGFVFIDDFGVDLKNVGGVIWLARCGFWAVKHWWMNRHKFKLELVSIPRIYIAIF